MPGPLPEAARFAERRSLEALLRKVPVAERAHPRTPARWAAWGAFVAAAVALFVLFPNLGDRSRNFAVEVVSASGPRGASGPEPRAAPAIHAGDPIVLSVRSPRETRVAVLLLDPAGDLAPLAVGEEAFRVASGVSEVPPPRDPPWVLPNAPGSYTFFVVELTATATAPDAWIETARAALLGAPERSRAEAVRVALASHVGPTQLARVEILP
jgi:hypothetical protein